MFEWITTVKTPPLIECGSYLWTSCHGIRFLLVDSAQRHHNPITFPSILSINQNFDNPVDIDIFIYSCAFKGCDSSHRLAVVDSAFFILAILCAITIGFLFFVLL